MLLKPMGKFLSPYVYVLISFKILYAVIRNVGHLSLFFGGGIVGRNAVGRDVVGVSGRDAPTSYSLPYAFLPLYDKAVPPKAGCSLQVPDTHLSEF